MTLTIVYSFNKRGFEAQTWTREIAAASDERVRFVPFNHEPYLPIAEYSRAQLLDNRFFARDPRLLRMYDDVRELIASSGAQALIADNCFPYHPDWLRTLNVYKVLRTSDGPLVAYDRDLAYLHAYDHVLYHSPAFSPELNMAEKLAYAGARRADFWPLGLFDAAFDPSAGEDDLFPGQRDIPIIYIGILSPTKMPLLAAVKKYFGRHCRMYGLTTWKWNAYFAARYRVPAWIRPISADQYVPLYRRARIGFNVHNRGMYTVGGYRLYELPANGVMQISDGGPYLGSFFEVGKEIVAYDDVQDLIAKLRHYLDHEDERTAIARNAYRRVLRDHRMRTRLHAAGELIERGMRERSGAAVRLVSS
jgi:glycosyltransferase involved in cell wall biosynthesis